MQARTELLHRSLTAIEALHSFHEFVSNGIAHLQRREATAAAAVTGPGRPLGGTSTTSTTTGTATAASTSTSTASPTTTSTSSTSDSGVTPGGSTTVLPADTAERMKDLLLDVQDLRQRLETGLADQSVYESAANDVEDGVQP